MVNAEPYLVLTVPWGEGLYSEAQCWSDHSQDKVFDTTNYNLDQPWVALDWEAAKYTTLGPGEKGGWTAYVWAGYHMVAGTPYSLEVKALAPSRIEGINFDGSGQVQATLQPQEVLTLTLNATPATANQWRTRGYKVTVLPVPELPSGVVLAILTAFAPKWRKTCL